MFSAISAVMPCPLGGSSQISCPRKEVDTGCTHRAAYAARSSPRSVPSVCRLYASIFSASPPSYRSRQPVSASLRSVSPISGTA